MKRWSRSKQIITPTSLSSQRGQATTEAILIIVVFVGMATLIANQFKQNEWLSDLVSKPWSILSGMIETGVWVDAKKAKNVSPYTRGVSIKPKESS